MAQVRICRAPRDRDRAAAPEQPRCGRRAADTGQGSVRQRCERARAPDPGSALSRANTVRCGVRLPRGRSDRRRHHRSAGPDRDADGSVSRTRLSPYHIAAILPPLTALPCRSWTPSSEGNCRETLLLRWQGKNRLQVVLYGTGSAAAGRVNVRPSSLPGLGHTRESNLVLLTDKCCCAEQRQRQEQEGQGRAGQGGSQTSAIHWPR